MANLDKFVKFVKAGVTIGKSWNQFRFFAIFPRIVETDISIAAQSD